MAAVLAARSPMCRIFSRSAQLMVAFRIVTGPTVRRIIMQARPEVIDTVRQAYLLHYRGEASQFLRFPAKPSARIIGLPAYIGGDYGVAGMKWIASFPENIAQGTPRASALLVLNDYDTGYPFACLEAAQISAARTAASAVLGAEQLLAGRRADRVAFIGGGVIARNILDFLAARQPHVSEINVFDTAAPYADAFAAYAQDTTGVLTRRMPSLEKTIAGADVVVLATTAAEPYIHAADTFRAGQVVLNISLRDIGPAVVAGAHNIVDDVDHCLTANTSVHLAEQALGGRAFIDGTLAQFMLGGAELGDDRPRIFSPFGLGVLDLAVGMLVYRAAVAGQQALEIDDFFGETNR
jgi:N-[(2S)-2-amino-2-carboxyethyl]-L-glutamate dehydrogenase